MASQHRRQSSCEDVLDLPGRAHVPLQSRHCHQAFFEGLINYSSLAPLTVDERSRAQGALDRIINHLANHSGTKGGYTRHLLVRHTYDYSQSELSKDTFLRVFFNVMGLDISSDEDINMDDDQMPSKFIDFADVLLEQFFFPLKAGGKITPQPSPAHLSAIQSVQSPHEIVGTSERVSYLRALCLIRDHHRCVISRAFDSQQAITRMMQHGSNARDDDGKLFEDNEILRFLEVAHIIPHSLVQGNENSELSDTKKMTLMILNMLDCDVIHLIEGTHIDSPRNAISLTIDFHKYFGNFDIYFEPIANQEHTYRIDSFLPPIFTASLGLPVTRKLLLSEGRVMDAPLPKLLALHQAIAHILHLSGAGEYIDRILRDFEETGVQEDGSTDLGLIVNLRLGGWLDGAVEAH
uniref:HNH nuclease domain-containing protein n=1 Tax=Coccidioides posadasii RMSCC 3488 TaxID=454284 RepID=A0A0J6IEB0_COCPO|nr:hypothetical protein CPAG_06404 [Coccidioides posadasii RMSCC 3488]